MRRRLAFYYLELQSALAAATCSSYLASGWCYTGRGSAIPNTEPRWRGLKAPSTAHTRFNPQFSFELHVVDCLCSHVNQAKCDILR